MGLKRVKNLDAKKQSTREKFEEYFQNASYAFRFHDEQITIYA